MQQIVEHIVKLTLTKNIYLRKKEGRKDESRKKKLSEGHGINQDY